MHIFHHIPLYILFAVVTPSLISAALMLPFTASALSNGNNTLVTSPTVGAVDERFKVVPTFDGPRLPVISCLMNIVKSLEALAYMDFSGYMQEERWSLSDHREVSIIISPEASESTMGRRYAVWGLQQAATTMIDLERFQSVRLSLLYDEVEVGTIKIGFRPRPGKPGVTIASSAANNTQALSQQRNVTFLNDTASTSENQENGNPIQAKGDKGLKVLATLTGSTVAPWDVFLLIIGVIAEAAELEYDERLHSYVSSRSIPRVEITFMEATPPRTTPPFLEAHWLIEAMAMIPDCMIRKGVFMEALLILEVNGVDVASGFLGTKDAAAGLSPANSNISVS